MKHPRTQHQEAIRTQIATQPHSSLLVNAVAGSGKSTTGVDCFDVMAPTTVKLAFNKSTAEELKVKAPAFAGSISTFHSLCFSLVRAFGPRGVKVNQYKVSNLSDTMELFDTQEQTYAMSRLIGLAKNNGAGVDNDAKLAAILDFQAQESGLAIEFEDDNWLDKAVRLYKRSAIDRAQIDFDDMLLFPMLDGHTLNGKPMAFIDEFQDLNPLQHALCQQFFSGVYAFGDRNQAIYAFRGADANSFDTGRDAFGAIELPLSTSFRCPRAVVIHAQSIVPHIQSFDGAEEGSVAEIGPEEVLSKLILGNTLNEQWLIVCRNNRPLGELSQALTAKGIEFALLGQDFSSIERIARKEPTATASSILARVRAKLEKWLARPGVRDGARDTMLDKQSTLELVFAKCRDGSDMMARISSLNRLRPRGITLSSIHRSKGLESDNVVIWQRSLLPSERAVTPSAIQQERNLEYVAITRARHNLYYFQ